MEAPFAVEHWCGGRTGWCGDVLPNRGGRTERPGLDMMGNRQVRRQRPGPLLLAPITSLEGNSCCKDTSPDIS